MDKRQENRIALILAAVLAVGIVAAVLLSIALRESLISWAQGWPGGPVVFLVSLGLVGALGVATTAAVWLVHAWPQRSPWQSQLNPPVRYVITTIGAVVALISTVVLISAMPPRDRDPSGCDELGCWLEVNESGAWVWGLTALGVTTWLASLMLAYLFASDANRRWAAVIPQVLIGSGLGILLVILASAFRFQETYYDMAESWPGGPRLFLISAGATVGLGAGGSVWAWTRRRWLTPWGAVPLVLAGVAITAAALSVLIAALAPRRYPGPALCDEGFYCRLDQSDGDATMTVALGWLTLLIAGVVVLIALIRSARARR
ncbi:hypothetical protein [Streptomyces xiamenensis]|uniref:hypothetical protein n=1 Tax=Streptomyces xiamenensis TaxID=408015 RepID=UPI003D70EADE